MSKDTKEEVKKQIVDEIDIEIVDELKKELRDEVKEDRKARIKGEIENEIEGVKVDNSKEQIKEKTLYDEHEGLYRLIKDNLTMAEAIVVQEEIKNDVYGKYSGWYRRHTDKNENSFGVWTKICSNKNMNSIEIAKLRESADIIEGGGNEETSKIEEQSKIKFSNMEKDIYRIERCCLDNTRRLLILIGALSGFSVVGGAVYLYHILHVESYILGVYGLVLVVIAVALLWIQCELRECPK